MTAALASFLVFVGFAGLFGGAVARRRLAGVTVPGGWPLWWGVGAGLILAGVVLGVGTTLAVLGFTAPGDVLAYLTATGPGRAALTTLLGTALLLAAGVGGWPERPSLGVTGLGAAITVWGIAGQGHGADHGLLVRLAHALHTGAMALWVGGVAALWGGRLRDWPGAARAFTPLAVVGVVMLTVSGLCMGLEHAGPISQWPREPYGRLVLVKVAVSAAALYAATRVRRHLSRRERPRGELLLELTLLVLVLGLTAVLVNSDPGQHGETGTSRRASPLVASPALEARHPAPLKNLLVRRP
ncbi:hypothetical protein DAETH_13860 [Deinococcus aetherius]|uniref:Copper resistance protein D domain-containing protein n=1 Tax=Deinococcus aetherius TaxID=200252 RepID=A0ABM8ACT4_9DEIO|nr:hypothetical protein DAETH_13860 [Deinococcus aetherius]